MSPASDFTDYAWYYKLSLNCNVHLLCFIRKEMIFIAEAVIAFIKFDHMWTIGEGCCILLVWCTNFIQKAPSQLEQKIFGGKAES